MRSSMLLIGAAAMLGLACAGGEGRVVEIDQPGSYDRPGTTYHLAADLSAPGTALYLGKDVVLDLGGHTLTFAAGGYGHVPNYDFEEGLEGWDRSLAPGAKLESTREVHVFTGEKILRLAAGDEIVSGWVELPLAERSYLAICGVLKQEMAVSLYVEDEQGQPVRCEQDFGDSARVCCPIERRSPRLGGGFVTAHLSGLPAGRYRVRVRAETDCLVDHIDLRPALDAGVAIIGRIYPWVHNDDLYAGHRFAFYDERAPGTRDSLRAGVPRVDGPGRVVIRNGTIRSAARGVLSWGIQSTAPEVEVVLENVTVVNQGINANAVDIPFGRLTHCRFEVDNPFIINRHISEHAVVLRGLEPSLVDSCEFIGGQGCLAQFGLRSEIRDNLFVNRQMVTNHYAIMARGDSSRIYRNRFEPEVGSGVEIFRHKFIEIFDNDFRVEASPPTCEYGHEEYSTTGIRIADYDARAGSPEGCYGNRVYRNRFHVIGRDFPEHPDYTPMAWAFYHSAGAGPNYYYDNEITVDYQGPGNQGIASALYIGGAPSGGVWQNNRITTNTWAAWVATWYGPADSALIEGNTIIRADNAPPGWKPVRIGFPGRSDALARGIAFRSNRVENGEFGIEDSGQPHSYALWWTLKVKVPDPSGGAGLRAEVVVLDRTGREAARGMTGGDDSFSVELPQYELAAGTRTDYSPYRVKVGASEKTITLDRNLELEFDRR